MTAYLIYSKIPVELYDKKLKYLISNAFEYRCKDNLMIGLYGWTTNKKYMKEFLQTRNSKMFNIVKKDIDKSDKPILKEKYFNLEIKPREFVRIDDNNKEQLINIITTLDEHIACTEDAEQWINEINIDLLSGVPVYLFNDKVFDALDILGYVDMYYLFNGTSDEDEEELQDMNDYTTYNNSYGFTTNGHKIINKTRDQVNVLLFLYSCLFG